MTQELEPLSQYIFNDHLRQILQQAAGLQPDRPEGLSLGADGLVSTTAPHLNCKRYCGLFLCWALLIVDNTVPRGILLYSLLKYNFKNETVCDEKVLLSKAE